ncbi:MAG: endo-1,4-beta-xylanase [Elainellaceae cyanobacterium]
MPKNKRLKPRFWFRWGLVLTVVCLIVMPFLLDHVQHQGTLGQPLAPSETSIIANTHSSSLRELAEQRGIFIGAAVLIDPFRNDEEYRTLLAREFNALTPENAMKFARLHPERDRYNFTDAADLVTFAEEHQMHVHGHPLVWHRNLPDWLTDNDWSRDELMEILRRHIYTVVGRFRGQVDAWDVVNEAVEGRNQLRESIWLDGIGPEYIQLAFRWAHEADPDAQLFYNDYKGEDLGEKSDAIYQLVRNLVQQGVPIHGVGFQMHTSIKDAPDPQDVADNIRRLNDLGLTVRITEMDVQIYGVDRPEEELFLAQKQVYHDMMQTCLAAEACNGLTTWGVSDQYSWIPYFFERSDAPLVFNEEYQPKPAYEGLVEALVHR